VLSLLLLQGVIVMAATNLPETLDPALKRPGRFDRQVTPAAAAHPLSLRTAAASVAAGSAADWHLALSAADVSSVLARLFFNCSMHVN
jgi:ATP-dependent 26S proteasome regulatory subunit